MTFELTLLTRADLPFQPGETAHDTIDITSHPGTDAIADGQTEPFDWMDLRCMHPAFEQLIAADEVVLDAGQATLVLDYPFERPVARELHAANGRAFSRGELMKRIDETYRRTYRLETETQSAPTPDVGERGQLLNRPPSDGVVGILGHDYGDLGVSSIKVYQIDGVVWLMLDMVS
jgi:hypothetical protein